MVSEKKLAATRLNSQKSRGPRTPEGKARSSRNATSHGIFCRDLVLSGEDADVFHALREAFLLRFSPQDHVELSLVDRIVECQWKLRRLQEAEGCLIESRAQRIDDHAEQKMQDLILDIDEEENEKDLDAEERQQRRALDRVSELVTHKATAAMSVALLMEESNSALDRLSRYQQRLENAIHRAMKELRELRKDKRATKPSPFSSSQIETLEFEDEEPSPR